MPRTIECVETGQTGPTRLADLTDADWELLHELRLRGVIEPPESERWEIVIAAGLATRRASKLVITPEGRAAHREWARCEEGSEDEERVQHAFDRFVILNAELLQLCSDWQVNREGTPNDHRDAAYDWSVIERLGSLDDERARWPATPVPRSPASLRTGHGCARRGRSSKRGRTNGSSTGLMSGADRTCAYYGNGDLWCWSKGNLGDGNDGWNGVPVKASTTATAVGAGNDAASAIDNSGVVQCWGYNTYGETRRRHVQQPLPARARDARRASGATRRRIFSRVRGRLEQRVVLGA